MTWAGTAIIGGIGGSIVGGYLGAEGSRDAANIQSAANERDMRLQQQMYLQGRQDLQPWMDVATGAPTYNQLYDPAAYDPASGDLTTEDLLNRTAFITAQAMGQVDAEGYALNELGAREVTGYGEGGALSQLAGYGRGDIAPGDYIPGSAIPEYAPGSNILDFGVAGNQPEYNRLADITQDPSYQFRKSEQDRAINRNMAGMGKIMSGNRLEELMTRSGDLASQEYGAAYGRNIQDYELERAREATGYGRDLTGFEQNRLAEASRYGRDIDAYNAAASQEALGYGRGVDAYGRAYGQEADYLSRLSGLASGGQSTATNVAGMGMNTAAGMGANITASGEAQAAGTLGQTGAWTGALGDLTALGTTYATNRNQPTFTTGAGGSYGWNFPGGISPNQYQNMPQY